MRRAWLLAFLLTPALAAAQATPGAGKVTFDDAFINADECTSTSTATITLSWNATFISTVTTPPSDGVYRVYASATAHTSPNCTATDGAIDPATGPTPTSTAQIMERFSYPAHVFATKAGKGACNAANDKIFVCVQGESPTAGNFGFATESLTLDCVRPAAVGLDPPLAGDTALELSWGASAEADPKRYRLTAQSISDPSNATSTSTADPLDPNPHVVTVTVTGYRLEDLVNDVTYKVVVSALDAAENVGDPSNVVTGTPKEVNDFWDLYHQRGREQGGCGAGGPAGVASLAGAIAILALLRRRK